MKKIVWVSILFVVIVLPNCKKKDVFSEPLNSENQVEMKNSNSHANKCDYAAAFSNLISISNEPGFTPLFKKYYKPGSSKLDKILVSFRNSAAPGANNPILLKVIYSNNSMIFLDDTNDDSVAVLNFDHSGKLQFAKTGLPLHLGWSYKTGFRFSYYQNKLVKIENSAEEYIGDDQYQTNWYPYVIIKYDHQKKNISEIRFPAFLAEGVKIKYIYNYSRRVSNQVYPDDMMGDFHYFFFFLKYLNIFPELSPDHLLIRSQTFNSDYPGDYERNYSNHIVDGSGKLVFYHQTSYLNDGQVGPDYFRTEKWKIEWACRQNGNNHHNHHN